MLNCCWCEDAIAKNAWFRTDSPLLDDFWYCTDECAEAALDYIVSDTVRDLLRSGGVA